MRKLSAIFGFLAVFTFLISFTIFFAFLSPDFNLAHDVASKLGSHNAPYAGWWNLIGFGLVGVLLGLFGVTYGKSDGDNVLAALLGLVGVTFVGGAVPAYLGSLEIIQTKIHFVMITFSMAFWCLALARLTSKPFVKKKIKIVTYISLSFTGLAFISYLSENTSPAIFQRLFFGGMFLWIITVSWDSLFDQDLSKTVETQ